MLRAFSSHPSNFFPRLQKFCKMKDWESTDQTELIGKVKTALQTNDSYVMMELPLIRDFWKAFALDPSLEAVYLEKLRSAKTYTKSRIYLTLIDKGINYPNKLSNTLSSEAVDFFRPKVGEMPSLQLVQLTQFMKAQAVTDYHCLDRIATRFATESNIDIVHLTKFVLKTYSRNPISFELEAYTKEKISLNLHHFKLSEAVDALALFAKSEIRQYMQTHIQLLNKFDQYTIRGLSYPKQLSLLLSLVKLRRKQLPIKDAFLTQLASRVYTKLIAQSATQLEIFARALSEINFEEDGAFVKLKEDIKAFGSESEFLNYLCLTASPRIQVA